MAKKKDKRNKIKDVKLEDTYAWEGAVGSAVGLGLHAEHKIRKGKLDKIIKSRAPHLNPNSAQYKNLKKFMVGSTRAGALLNGMLWGGFAGLLATKKSGKEKVMHNRRVMSKRWADYDKKYHSKKAEFIMEKNAGAPSLFWKIMGLGGKAAKKGGEVAIKTVDKVAPKAIPAIKKTTKKVVDYKPKSGPLKGKQPIKSTVEGTKKWVVDPAVKGVQGTKRFIWDYKTYNNATLRNLGRFGGFPLRHPTTTAGLIGGGMYVKNLADQDAYRANLRKGKNVSYEEYMPRNQKYWEAKLVVPDSSVTNYRLRKDYGYKGPAVSQDDIHRTFAAAIHGNTLKLDHGFSDKRLKQELPSWANLMYDDLQVLVGNRNAIRQGPQNFGDYNYDVQNKWKNAPVDPADLNKAYQSLLKTNE